jgi:hypothetical protein
MIACPAVAFIKTKPTKVCKSKNSELHEQTFRKIHRNKERLGNKYLLTQLQIDAYTKKVKGQTSKL